MEQLSFENYINYYTEILNKNKAICPTICQYAEDKLEELKRLMNQPVDDKLQSAFFKAIALDVKIQLTDIWLNGERFGYTDEEIIHLIEKDHVSFNLEICGYDRKKIPPYSLIFMSEPAVKKG